MREGAARAILDPSAIFLEIPGIPGAVLQAVHGAVAEQAAEGLRVSALMAGKIFAFPVLKEFIVLAHGLLPTGSPVFTLLSMPRADHLAISAAGSNFPCSSSRMTVEPPYSK